MLHSVQHDNSKLLNRCIQYPLFSISAVVIAATVFLISYVIIVEYASVAAWFSTSLSP